MRVRLVSYGQIAFKKGNASLGFHQSFTHASNFYLATPMLAFSEGQDRHNLLSQSDYHIMGTQINKRSLGNMCPVLTEETLSSTRSVPVSDLVVQERESKLLK